MFLILKPEESGLFQNSHELMGWRITIRSSRDRFAASLVALSCSTPLGRCASRLNSGDIPQTLLEVLSDEEKAEVEFYIANTRAKNQKCNNALSIQYIASNLDRVADLVLGGVEDYELSEQWGVEVWAALEKMQKSLRKAGFKRPLKQPNPKPVKQQQAGFELNQQWAEEALVALDAVQQTLKKAGFKLPVKRAKSKPVNQQQAGLDLD